MSNFTAQARALLEKMTLTEKVGQLAQCFRGFNAFSRDDNGEIVLTEEFKQYVLRFGGIGVLYGFFRSDPWSRRGYQTGGIVASKREKAYNILQKFVIENTRLGIPVLMTGDAVALRVTLPAGVTATLRLPCGYKTDETELRAGEQIITVYKS